MRHLFGAKIALLGICIWLLCASAFAQTSHPTAFTLSKPSTYSQVELSPSGDHVAAIVKDVTHYCLGEGGRVLDPEKGECRGKPYEIESRVTVYIYSLDNFQPVQNFNLPQGGSPIRLEWANDERLLVTGFWPPFIKGNMIFIGGMRMFSVPISGKEAIYLFNDKENVSKQNWNLSRITNPLRIDPEHIIMPARNNEDLDLWKVNVINGKTERIAKGRQRTFYWYTDEVGRPVMRFDCSGRFCRKVYVYVPDSEDEGKWKKIKSFKTRPDEDNEEYDFWPIAQSDDPDKFYVMSYEDEDERQSIKLFDLKTERFTKTVYEHPRLDVGGALIDALTGHYAGAFFIDDRLDYAFADPTRQSHYDKIKAHFNNDENVKVLGFNKTDSKAVVYVTSPSNPGAYHVYEAATGEVVQLFNRNEDLPDKFTTKTDILKIPAQDGTLLTVYHTQAKTPRADKAPLIVMPHGGPEARDSYDYDPWVQYFAMRGFQVMQVNFRGSSGYGRQFAEAGYGQWGRKMQSDVMDAAQHFYDQGLASPENACIVGYSYGGYAALFAGATTPEKFACIVGGGGVTDLPRFLKQIKKDHGKNTGLYDYWTTSIGDPKEEKDLLKTISPAHMAASFQKPVLLLHGNKDKVVDVSQSKRMHTALKKAGKDVAFIELKGAGHSGWVSRNDVIFLEGIEDFLAEHLTGQDKP